MTRRFPSGRISSLPAALLLLGLVPSTTWAQRATLGEWSAPMSWPVGAVHMATLPNGKVLTWGHTGDEVADPAHQHHIDVWEPSTGQHVSLHVGDAQNNHDMFCGSSAFLADGTLVVATGAIAVADPRTTAFDWRTNSVVATKNMNQGRYYPTTTTLGDGTVLMTGGWFGSAAAIGAKPEVFTATGWRTLANAHIDFAKNPDGEPDWGFIDNSSYFPWTVVAPNGRVFYAGPENKMRWIDTAGAGAVTYAGEREPNGGKWRDYGNFVPFTTGKILVAGGGGPGSSWTAAPEDTWVIDINSGTPQVTRAGDLAFGRRQSNLTLLANGEVFINGGYGGGRDINDGQAQQQTAVYAGEIWNPATGAWRTVASATSRFEYHSSATLLPDGRVLAASGPCNTCQASFLAQVYSPPHLFDASGNPAVRPVISSAPEAIAYGQTFTVAFSSAPGISKAHIIRLGSVTHATNFDQRLVPLSFTLGSGSLTVSAPASGNIAPPGYYMLFLVNGAGVPSVAKILKVGSGLSAPLPVDLPVGRLVSFQSLNLPGRAIRHTNYLGYLEPVSAGSPAQVRNDASFFIRPGLADASCVSFEARNLPGYYLRHQDRRVKLSADDGSALLRQDATWCPKAGLAGSGVSFQAKNLPGSYLRHINLELWLQAPDGSAQFNQDATFTVFPAWSFGMPRGGAGSFQSVNVTGSSIRHLNYLGQLSPVGAGSPAQDREDATFYVRAGLADASCVSFEAKNLPGYYLRHQDRRVKLQASTGTALFRQDATWCPNVGLTGFDVSFQSKNLPGSYLRHTNYELWLEAPDGSALFNPDATFRAIAPWSP